MLGRWISRRLACGAAVGVAYSLWLIAARLPSDLGWATWTGSAGLTGALVVAAGSLLAGAVGLIALAAGAWAGRWRAVLSAAVETLVWLPLLVWLVLNEFLYSTTSEVLGAGALMMLWYNTAAVLQNAWAMGAKYLIATGIIVVAASALIYRTSVGSFRKMAHRSRDPGGAIWRSAFTKDRWTRPISGGVALLVGLAAWQLLARPSEALTVVCRSAPPLRAFNLVQSMAEEKLRGPIPTRFGSPVISDEQYAASIGPVHEHTPNIIYLLLESTPAKALHCYGHPKADVSPNLDRLAAEGVLFRHCIAPSSFSSCSVVGLATSLYMLRGERFDYFSQPTFPFMSLTRALKLAGYELALFSSGSEDFDNINHFCSPADFDHYYSRDTCPIPQPDCMRMDDKFAVGEFEKWLAARTDRRPFYAGFYLQSPHFNYEVPEPWASHDLPIPPLYSNGDGILHIPADVLPMLKNQYDNAIRYADYWVGQIVDALGKAGALDNTIIVATGDHGEAFMEHGLARHGVHTWEEMIHTPLIIWLGPKARSYWNFELPSTVAATVSGIDITPTIAGLVGMPPYPGWQGVNVLDPAYTGRDRPVFSMTQYTRWQETALIDGIKFIYDLTDAREYLFDLRSDPDERHDLVDENPALADAMRQVVAGWHRYQIAYYSVANRDVYPGRYEPDRAILQSIHQSAGR